MSEKEPTTTTFYICYFLRDICEPEIEDNIQKGDCALCRIADKGLTNKVIQNEGGGKVTRIQVSRHELRYECEYYWATINQGSFIDNSNYTR